MTPENRPPKMGTGMVASIVAMFGAIFAFFFSMVFFYGQPYGEQMLVASTYTCFIIVGAFFDTRHYRGYPLWEKYVQRTLPTVVLIHLGFLALIAGVQTYVIHIAPHLPAALTSEHGPKHASNLETICLVALVLVSFIELHICRKRLARALEQARRAVPHSPASRQV